MINNNISRRKFFKTALTGIAISFFGQFLLSACKKNPKNENLDPPLVAAKNTELNEQEKSIRQNLHYVDQSPIKGRTCKNCKLYVPNNQASMGTCKIVPGPIHPEGYCISWVQLM